MQVFKTYFKIIKKNLPSMSIYFFIFLFFSIALSNTGTTKSMEAFQSTKSNIAFINEDGDSLLASGLKDYLAENATIVNVKEDRQSLQDALFFRNVEYIVRVPKGFSQDFMNGNNIMLEKMTVPDSTAGMYMDSLIDRYLNTAKIYVNSPGLTETQLNSMVGSDLKIKTDVQVKSYGQVQNTGNASYYFSYFAYSMMAIVILGLTSIMMVFNEPNLKKRNLCSPLKSGRMSMQLILGSLLFGIIVWVLMTVLSIPIYGTAIIGRNFALWSLNALIFTFVCLSISFLVGNLIKSRSAQSAIANVLSLGFCFISGVFVPQDLLGKTVQTIASFTPTYWYIKAINAVKNLTAINAESLKPIIYSMLVQLGFALAILALALVVVKQKRVTDQ